MRYCICCRQLTEREVLGVLIEELCVGCELDTQEYLAQYTEEEAEDEILEGEV